MTPQEELEANAKIVRDAVEAHIKVIQKHSPALDGFPPSRLQEIAMAICMMMGAPGETHPIRVSWQKTLKVIDAGFEAWKTLHQLESDSNH
jgi:hypothetical protein